MQGERTRTAAGVTLIEVLVALLILSVVALGFMTFLGISLRQGRLSTERSVATGLATSRLQQLTSMPFQAAGDFARYRLLEETATAGPPATLTTAAGAIPGNPDYNRTVTLEYDTPVAGMLKAKVDVTWFNRAQNLQKTHTLITFLQPSMEEIH